VAIGAGAYYDAELRYEALRLAEVLREPMHRPRPGPPAGPAGAGKNP
jgi:hypothetical protein